MSTVVTKKKMKKYRLLRGSHAEGKLNPNKPGQAVPQHVYRHDEEGNNIITTDVDLLALHGKQKFELIHREPETQSTSSDDLDSMTVEQLKNFALENEIDLGEITLKAEIVSHIRATLNAR